MGSGAQQGVPVGVSVGVSLQHHSSSVPLLKALPGLPHPRAAPHTSTRRRGGPRAAVCAHRHTETDTQHTDTQLDSHTHMHIYTGTHVSIYIPSYTCTQVWLSVDICEHKSRCSYPGTVPWLHVCTDQASSVYGAEHAQAHTPGTPTFTHTARNAYTESQ